jgi:hypothetical protein
VTVGAYAIDSGSNGIVQLLGSGRLRFIGGPGAQFDGTSPSGMVALSPDRSMVMELNPKTWSPR